MTTSSPSISASRILLCLVLHLPELRKDVSDPATVAHLVAVTKLWTKSPLIASQPENRPVYGSNIRLGLSNLLYGKVLLGSG